MWPWALGVGYPKAGIRDEYQALQENTRVGAGAFLSKLAVVASATAALMAVNLTRIASLIPTPWGGRRHLTAAAPCCPAIALFCKLFTR